MTIETKFNVGDKVWYIHNNKIQSRRIERASNYQCKFPIITWDMEYDNKEITSSTIMTVASINEDKIFETKEELIKSL